MDNTPIWESTTPDWETFEEPPPPGGMNPEAAMSGFSQMSSAEQTFWTVAGLVGLAAGVYHGMKRNSRHPGWSAAGYGALGGMLPIVGIPVMLAQGYAKPKRG